MQTLTLQLTDEQATRLQERASAQHLSVQESALQIVQQSLERTNFAYETPQSPREGWAMAFKLMHENGDDMLLIDSVFKDETFEEWK
jgi:hypothetical protein